MTPINTAMPKPPPHASAGTTTDHPLTDAYTAVERTPVATPSAPPRTARTMASRPGCIRSRAGAAGALRAGLHQGHVQLEIVCGPGVPEVQICRPAPDGSAAGPSRRAAGAGARC
jgi:hypothetical protein